MLCRVIGFKGCLFFIIFFLVVLLWRIGIFLYFLIFVCICLFFGVNFRLYLVFDLDFGFICWIFLVLNGRNFNCEKKLGFFCIDFFFSLSCFFGDFRLFFDMFFLLESFRELVVVFCFVFFFLNMLIIGLMWFDIFFWVALWIILLNNGK